MTGLVPCHPCDKLAMPGAEPGVSPQGSTNEASVEGKGWSCVSTRGWGNTMQWLVPAPASFCDTVFPSRLTTGTVSRDPEKPLHGKGDQKQHGFLQSTVNRQPSGRGRGVWVFWNMKLDGQKRVCKCTRRNAGQGQTSRVETKAGSRSFFWFGFFSLFFFSRRGTGGPHTNNTNAQ